MAGIRAMLQVLGVLATVIGLFWVGQGLGVIMWPQSSAMIGDRQWAIIGAILAVFGLTGMRLSRRR